MPKLPKTQQELLIVLLSGAIMAKWTQTSACFSPITEKDFIKGMADLFEVGLVSLNVKGDGEELEAFLDSTQPPPLELHPKGFLTPVVLERIYKACQRWKGTTAVMGPTQS